MDIILFKQNDICFELCTKKLTAKVINSPSANGDIIIPYSIIYESTEYIITSIGKGSFKDNWNIESIRFPSNSEIRSFEAESFFCSSLQSINFPPKLDHLEEGWCQGTSEITNISISSKNKNFFFIDSEHKIVVNKNNVLIFACRDIEQVTIPDMIKQISSFAFCKCENLKSIQFSKDSKIEFIGQSAFSGTPIKNISIPKSVKYLSKKTFYLCEKLENVELSDFIESIGEYCFFCTSIKSISISNKVCQISKGAFSRCRFLKNVEIKENSQLCCIEEETFFASSIESIFIPEKIQKICDSAFCECNKLKKINFSKDSQLNSIGSKAFYRSSIENILIPSFVTEIGNEAFKQCLNLKKVEFNVNSNLHSIGQQSFADSMLEHILIPSNVKKINENAFASCSLLRHVEFLCNDVEIKNSCFILCKNLVIVSFPDVQYISISNDAFELISKDFLLYINSNVIININ